MSPRAAWRLEELGFERAYDFVGGKTAWIERGLPTEGTGPFLLVAGQVLRPATATCRPGTRAGQVRAELEPGPDSICAVTNDHSIVVGRVRWKDLPEDDDVRVGGFMQVGPATVRPREELRGPGRADAGCRCEGDPRYVGEGTTPRGREPRRRRTSGEGARGPLTHRGVGHLIRRCRGGREEDLGRPRNRDRERAEGGGRRAWGGS